MDNPQNTDLEQQCKGITVYSYFSGEKRAGSLLMSAIVRKIIQENERTRVRNIT